MDFSANYVIKMKNSRKSHEELILRFFALNFDIDNYKAPMKHFLNIYMNKNRNFKYTNKEEIESIFDKVMDIFSKDLLKEHICLIGSNRVNTQLLDSIFIGIAKNLDNPNLENDGYLVGKINELKENINTDGVLGGLDTIFRGIEFQEDKQAYKTWLPTKIYLGANYRLFQKSDVSFLSYNEYYNNRFKTSLRVAFTQRVRNWLMATINYSFYGRSAANVGLGFSVNGGPIQFYAVSDNALSYLFPTKTKNFHLRVGINLTFANNYSQN